MLTIVPKEELDRQKLEDGWSYAYDGDWTNIYYTDDSRLVVFYSKLTYDEIRVFKAGFENGFKIGRNHGILEKSEEIKKALKL